MSSAATKRAVWCSAALFALACHPADANLGGEWSCPLDSAASCFYFDSQLGAASADDPTLRERFDVAEDPSPLAAPSIAYPLDQTTEPANIYDLDIQWHRPRVTQTLFRIRVESPRLPYGRYDIYTRCLPSHDGCHYSVPSYEWNTNVITPLKGSNGLLTVAGADEQSGLVAVSAPVRLRFSYAPVPGGLYYWSAHPPNAAPDSMDQGTTYRLAFSGPQHTGGVGTGSATPFIRPESKENPDKCEGCHAVSGDGTRIAFTATDNLDGPEAGSFIAKSTTAPSGDSLVPVSSTPDSTMIALSNDGNLAVVGLDNELSLRNLNDATAPPVPIPAALLAPEGHGYFPDFSPDGKHLVVTLSDHPDEPWAVSTGSIATLDFDGTNFSQAKVLVPMTDQEFHFYPSWSPDNQWIVFASAPRGFDPLRPGCSDPTDTRSQCQIISYDQPRSRLRLVHYPDGRVYDLDRATQGVGLTSTLPKFAPLPTNGHNQLFITFNSKMPYGVEVPSNIPAQLWLSVLDLDLLPDDPSGAPVWLPFQSFGQKNHLAYWCDNVPCRTDLDSAPQCGPDEDCIMVDHEGFCTPKEPVVK